MVFPILGGNGAVAGYSIDNSLRFNNDDSPYLTATQGSGGNRRTWTFSCWAKLSVPTADTYLFSCADGGNSIIEFKIQNHELVADFFDGSTSQYRIDSSNLLRDASAWYHLVLRVDTTQSTSADRVRMYINGTQVTAFNTNTVGSQNYDTDLNNGGTIRIGADARSPAGYFDGYMTEVCMIEGQSLAPTSFAEADEDSGIWKPIDVSGLTFGTNGFYLDFENSGSLGADQSGNGNNFTPTNLASTDQTTDTPTNNFATLNPLQRSSTSAVLSEGNCKLTNNTTSNPWQSSYSTIGMNTGKWYWEYKVDSQNASIDPAYGIVADSNTQYQDNTYGNLLGGQDSTASSYGISFYGGDGTVYWSHIGGFSNSSAFGGHSVGDIIGVAVDFDNDAIYFSVNGTYVNSGDPTSGASKTGAVTTGFANNQTWFAQGQCYTSSDSISANFGNAPYSISSGNSDGNGYGNFEYAPPSGYLALCTQNLATALSPTIDDGSQYFNTVLYSGNSGANSVTGVGFQPDFLWIKSRNAAENHVLFNSNVGAGSQLRSNTTGAETSSAYIDSFDTDGFSMNTALKDTNFSSYNYVSWSWLASGGTTSSNTDGSITSTVQANTTAGFSIVTFTGTGLDATVGHGLNVAPDMVIVKSRDAVRNWPVYHRSLGGDDSLKLNLTDATTTSLDCWNDLDPTSTVVHLGTTGGSNVSGENAIMYCFHSVEGYSKFGSYTGNGSTDGTFVYTGFRPAWVMIKVTDTTEDWWILDTTRDTFNSARRMLYADGSSSEINVSEEIDFLSNGFKLRRSTTGRNGSGNSYIYMAFAENPFVSSSGVPVVAR